MQRVHPLSRKALLAAATAGAFVLTGRVAHASFIVGESVVMPYRGSASVQFVSQNAGAKGALYYYGFERGHSITLAPSTDTHNLGEFLFFNHGTPSGHTVNLMDVFQAGDILHFAYKIVNGVSVAPTGQVQRTDSHASYFGVDDSLVASHNVQKVFLEDILRPAASDWDYNDLVFNIHTLSVPAPGAAAIAAVAGLVALPRRRPAA